MFNINNISSISPASSLNTQVDRNRQDTAETTDNQPSVMLRPGGGGGEPEKKQADSLVNELGYDSNRGESLIYVVV